MKQIISRRSVSVPSGNNWSPFLTHFRVTSAEVQSRTAWFVDGTFRTVMFKVDTAPGSGKSWTFDVKKNGSTVASVVIADTATSGFSLASWSTSATDYYTLQITAASSPTAMGGLAYSVEFESAGNESGYAHMGGLAGSGNRKIGVFWETNQSSAADTYYNGSEAVIYENIAGCAGTLEGYCVRYASTTGAGNEWTTTVYKNGVAQTGAGGTVDTVLTHGTAASASKTFSLSLAAGDYVYIHVAIVGSGGNDFSLATRFSATTAGESVVGGVMNTLFSGNASARYLKFTSVTDTIDTTESTKIQIGHQTSFTLSGFRVRQSAASGASKDYVYTIRQNAATPASGPVVTISGASETTDTDGANSVLIEDGDTWNLMFEGTTLGTSIYASWVAVQEPVAPTVTATSIIGDGCTVAGLSRVMAVNLDGVTRTHSNAALAGAMILGGNFTLIEQSSAPTGVTNVVRIWAEDNGSGKTRLMAQFPTGSAVQLAIEP
jgi:hypothetical protein